jgi:carbon storage regulator
MLVLSRQRDETIKIGDDIDVTVVDIRLDGKVRLGITAPKAITVHRYEVYRQIQQSLRASSIDGTVSDAVAGDAAIRLLSIDAQIEMLEAAREACQALVNRNKSGKYVNAIKVGIRNFVEAP